MNVAALAAGLDRSRIDGDPDVEIGALAYNTRDVARRHRFSFASPDSRPTATTSPPQAVAAGAVALVCERATAPAGHPGHRAARRGAPWRSWRRACTATRPASCGSSPSPAPTARRRRRTCCRRSSPRRACGPALLGTVVNRIAGVERRRQAHHRRVARPAAPVSRDGRRRRPVVRHGGLVARPGARAHDRHRLRGASSSPT